MILVFTFLSKTVKYTNFFFLIFIIKPKLPANWLYNCGYLIVDFLNLVYQYLYFILQTKYLHINKSIWGRSYSSRSHWSALLYCEAKHYRCCLQRPVTCEYQTLIETVDLSVFILIVYSIIYMLLYLYLKIEKLFKISSLFH